MNLPPPPAGNLPGPPPLPPPPSLPEPPTTTPPQSMLPIPQTNSTSADTTTTKTTTKPETERRQDSPRLAALKKRIARDITLHSDPLRYPTYARRWNFDTAPLKALNKNSNHLLTQYLRWASNKVVGVGQVYEEKIITKAFQRLSNYCTFSERHRGVLMRPPLTHGSVRSCYGRLGVSSMKRLDNQGRRVVCIDLSCYKRYDELHPSTSSKKNGDGDAAATKLVETDYLRLLYFVCHTCLFDNIAIDRGVVGKKHPNFFLTPS